jgi:hypothetical protein
MVHDCTIRDTCVTMHEWTRRVCTLEIHIQYTALRRHFLNICHAAVSGDASSGLIILCFVACKAALYFHDEVIIHSFVSILLVTFRSVKFQCLR